MGKRDKETRIRIGGKDESRRAWESARRGAKSFKTELRDTTLIINQGLEIGRKFTAAVGAMGRAFAEPIRLSAEQAKADAKLQAVLKSTGEAAGLTFGELKRMASGLQEVTEFGDESTQQAQQLLLTFTKIGREVFPRATETVLDMAVAMEGGLKEASLQLGKALNDPVKGVSALAEVGVSFTDSQKEMIRTLVESNRTAEAQTVILDELQKEFGGTARAVTLEFGGAVQQLENDWGDLLEILGDFITKNPVIRELISATRDEIKGWSSDLHEFRTAADGQQAANELTKDVLITLLELFRAIGTAMRAVSVSVLELTVAVGRLTESEVALDREQGRLITQLQSLREEIDHLNSTGDLEMEYRAFELEKGAAALERRLRELQDQSIATARDVGGGLFEAIDRLIARLEDVSTSPLVHELEAAIPQMTEDFGKLDIAIQHAFRENPAEAMAQAVFRIQQLMLSLKSDLPTNEFAAIQRQVFRLGTALKSAPIEVQFLEALKIAEKLETRLEDVTSKVVEQSVALEGSAASWETINHFAGQIPEQLQLGLEQAALFDEQLAQIEQRAESIGSNLQRAIVEGLSDPSTFEGLRFVFGGLTEDLKAQMISALIEPTLEAEGAFGQLTGAVLEPFQAIGKQLNQVFFQPLITGIMKFLGVKTAQEALAAKKAIALQQAVAAATAAGTGAILAGMMPGLASAAALALVSSFGSAAANVSLLPGILATAAAEGKAAAATVALPIPGADFGGTFTRHSVIQISEGNRTETVVPEDRPARAREILADMAVRRSDLFSGLSAAGGRNQRDEGAIGFGGVDGGGVTLVVQSFGQDADSLGELLRDVVNQELGSLVGGFS